MTVVTIAVLGLTAVFLAIQLKGMKGEYGIYLVSYKLYHKKTSLYRPFLKIICLKLLSFFRTYFTI